MYYKNHIFCCLNERPCNHVRGCCKEKDAVKLFNYLKARTKELGIENTRVNRSGCLDACEYGAIIVIYPEGTWYNYKTTKDIDDIINQHILNNTPVERLIVKRNKNE